MKANYPVSTNDADLLKLNITRRELQILNLMAEGKPAMEIAFSLKISHQTVRSHQKNIYQKTGAHNQIEALNKTKLLRALFTNTNQN